MHRGGGGGGGGVGRGGLGGGGGGGVGGLGGVGVWFGGSVVGVTQRADLRLKNKADRRL